jgi:hypothetical protein
MNTSPPASNVAAGVGVDKEITGIADRNDVVGPIEVVTINVSWRRTQCRIGPPDGLMLAVDVTDVRERRS